MLRLDCLLTQNDCISSNTAIVAFASGLLISGSLIYLYIIWGATSTKRTSHGRLYPPVIHIPADAMFHHPREAYESALQEHGPIIGVPRKGRLEYIVNREFTKCVFSDDKTLSFELGVASILNLRPVISLGGKTFFKDLDKLVTEGINPRLLYIVPQVFPVFRRRAKELLNTTWSNSADPQAVDIFEFVHRSIAEAMIILILGKSYVSDRNLKTVEVVAADIAILTGIYQNTSVFARQFPLVWMIFTWLRVMVMSVGFGFCRVIGPSLWYELRSRTFRIRPGKGIDDDNLEEPLLYYMGRMQASADGKLSITGVLWTICLCIGIIFASVHQTASVAVWVVFELSSRPSYISTIRDEIAAVAEVTAHGETTLSYDSLRNTKYLDSFVREVMRTKGDTLAVTRETTTDVPMGGYIIPKGHLVIPLTSLSHQSQEIHGDQASVFNGFRWVETGEPATMLSLGYFPFGLNRWACPGRVLAVAEIKMIVMSLFSIATPVLEGGKYVVVDPLNITSVPPKGRVHLQPLKTPVLAG